MEVTNIIEILEKLPSKRELTESESHAIDQAVRILKDPFGFALENNIQEQMDDYKAVTGVDISDIHSDILSNIDIDEEKALFVPIEQIVWEMGNAYVRGREEAKKEAEDLEREYQESRL